MRAYRHSYYSPRRRNRKRAESPTAAKRRKFSESVGGIDNEVQAIFLALPAEKLDTVFRRYGQAHGAGALSYAKRTYPGWKSGSVKMSGAVAQRLLSLVPIVLETEKRYEWVKKLRSMYMHKEHRRVSCSPSNWFKMVVPAVDELIDRSRSFHLPADVIEKVNWVTEGDALAAQKLLAAIEIDEATGRKQFLAREYQQIGYLLEKLNGKTSATHVIQLPQGTVEVTIVVPNRGLLRRLSLAKPGATDKDKQSLFVTCKNPTCRAELETTLRGYDGEPIVCTAGNITCDRCGATDTFDDRDLHVATYPPRLELCQKLFGGYEIGYDCPNCGTRLKSPLEDAGISDNCPRCRKRFTVPGKHLLKKEHA